MVDSKVVGLHSIIHHRTVVKLLIVIIHELRHLPHLLPLYVLPQKLQPVHILQLPIQPEREERNCYILTVTECLPLGDDDDIGCLPSAKEEAAEGGEEEPRLQIRMHKVNRFEVLLDANRHSFVDRTEGCDSRAVLAPKYVCMHVHHREWHLLELRIHLFLQVLLQHLGIHETSCKNQDFEYQTCISRES